MLQFLKKKIFLNLCNLNFKTKYFLKFYPKCTSSNFIFSVQNIKYILKTIKSLRFYRFINILSHTLVQLNKSKNIILTKLLLLIL